MSRQVSLNARTAMDAPASDELEIVLIHITHPLIDEPVRLSSDPTTRISLEPLSYGTPSTWLTEDGSPFLFIMMGAQLPDEDDDAPAAGSLVLEILDSDIATILTSTTVQAIVSMAVVLASSPDLVEAEFLDMRMVSADIDAGQIVMSFTKEPITAESYPAARMTKERFPGMHQ